MAERMMTDRPVIMSAPMVRATLGGRKGMMRRYGWSDCPRCPGIPSCKRCKGRGVVPTPWQKVKPGDRLYVRETWSPEYFWQGQKPSNMPIGPVWYWADGNPSDGDWARPRVSIHMPRWASRLTLVVTATKIERLRDISEQDARAEGTQEPSLRELSPELAQAAWSEGQVFARLWNHLHGAGAWESNPEVVALTFRAYACNIDHMDEGAVIRRAA